MSYNCNCNEMARGTGGKEEGGLCGHQQLQHSWPYFRQHFFQPLFAGVEQKGQIPICPVCSKSSCCSDVILRPNNNLLPKCGV